MLFGKVFALQASSCCTVVRVDAQNVQGLSKIFPNLANFGENLKNLLKICLFEKYFSKFGNILLAGYHL